MIDDLGRLTVVTLENFKNVVSGLLDGGVSRLLLFCAQNDSGKPAQPRKEALACCGTIKRLFSVSSRRKSLSGVQPDSNLLRALKLRGFAASKRAGFKAANPRCLLVKSINGGAPRAEAVGALPFFSR